MELLGFCVENKTFYGFFTEAFYLYFSQSKNKTANSVCWLVLIASKLQCPAGHPVVDCSNLWVTAVGYLLVGGNMSWSD